MNQLIARSRPPLPASVALVLAAIAFVIGGVDHARLFHRGYAEVEVVGPLFLLNAIGTLVVVLLLAFDRVRLFVLGVLAISLGSIVSIVISHSSSFFGFAEGGYDTDATVILAAEAASVLLVLLACALGALRTPSPVDQASRPHPLAIALGALSAVVLALAIAGVATGSAPKNDPAPTAKELASSKAAIASGNAAVQHGEALFESQHCDSCHAVAAIGAKGKLGPRMDAQDDPLRDIVGNITDPRTDIKPGYEGKLMPTDYASRMSAADIKDLARFVKAASKRGK
jgi:mono/diheme cytochrome c family protein